MPKSKNFKEKFDKEFNIENMHEKILFQIRSEKQVKKRYPYLAFASFLIIFGSIVLLPPVTQKLQNNNKIYINEISDLSTISVTLSSNYNIEEEKITAQRTVDDDIIEKVKLPSDLTLNDRYNVYLKNNLNDNEDILHDEVLYYSSKERTAKISYSSVSKPLQNYNLSEDALISKINNTAVKIYTYEDLYLSNFVYNQVYYFIETKNFSKNELIDLIESIIN